LPNVGRLSPAQLAALSTLLFTPAADLAASRANRQSPITDPTPLTLSFLSHHFDLLLLNSFRWPDGID
jgi:hypothetical protein